MSGRRFGLSIGFLFVFALIFFGPSAWKPEAGNPLPDEVSTADTGVFVMPASLRIIKENAFEGTNAAVVLLSENVETIESRAFANASSLSYIYFPSATRYISDDAFEGVSDLTIMGPQNSFIQEWTRARAYTFIATGERVYTAKETKQKLSETEVHTSLFARLQDQSEKALVRKQAASRALYDVKPIGRKERVGMLALDMYFP